MLPTSVREGASTLSPRKSARSPIKPLEQETFELPLRKHQSKRWTSKQWQLCAGIVGVVLGVIFLLLGTIIATAGQNYRLKRIQKTLVVDSSRHHDYFAWSKNTQTRTPVYHTYYFYNITNPQEFLTGSPPVVDELGPYTFQERSEKVNIRFSDDGRLVTYVNLYKYDFRGDKARLDDQINFFNLPYSAAVATVGGEKNLLKMGVQEGMNRMFKEMAMYFIPTIRENALVTAITKSLAAINGLQDLPGMPADQTAIRFGGGCVTYIWKACGFGDLAMLLKFLDNKNTLNLNLLQLCLNTKLEINNELKIPSATVHKLWDPKDKLGFMNVDRNPEDQTDRYGISYWLWGDDAIKKEIMEHFDITKPQFETLKKYLMAIYNSPLLLDNIIHQYVTSLPAEEQHAASTELHSYDDFIYRQWARGDVINRLQGTAELESVQADNPPEFAWYQKTLEGELNKRKWSRPQAVCLFDVSKRGVAMYFQTKVLRLPSPATSREQFVDDVPENTPDRAKVPDIEKCFPDPKDWELLQGYISYMATNLVTPEFNKEVLLKNGGLITSRTVMELIYGHKAPILKALKEDDPRSTFALSIQDKKLHGPAVCQTSADVDQPYSACALTGTFPPTDDNPEGKRIFSKVGHTYHTGKGDLKKLGAFYAFHGDKVAWGIWPKGNLTITGATTRLPGSVQYGYSDGMVFPPFGAVEKAESLYVFVPQFIMPMRLTPADVATSRGITLRRFTVASDTFSPSRRDAALFSMEADAQDGLLNLSDLNVAPTYLSKPHYRGQDDTLFGDIKGLKPYDQERDDSFIDVEPETGKTMRAKMQFQLSASTDTGIFNLFHADVYQTKALPVMYMVQHAEVGPDDAHFFVTQVYGSEKMIGKATTATCVTGAVLVLLGLILALPVIAKKRREHKRKASSMSSFNLEEGFQ